MSVKSGIEFANWLRKEHPALYRQAANAADAQVSAETPNRAMAGLGEEDAKTGWFSSFVGNVAAMGGTYLNLKNQRDQLKINLQRAQIGLEPIDVAGTPILTTRVELPPAMIEKITQSAGMNINKILMFAGLALVGLLAFKKFA